MDCKLKWFKFKSNAVIPTKKENAAGYDVYTVEDFVRLEPHSQFLFSTGLGVMIEGNYWLMAFDRGSTGSRGMHVHCGVIDKDYRGTIFICIKNDNDYPVIVTCAIDKPYFDEILKVFYYPACKAIAQLIPVAMPTVESNECSSEEWSTDTERGIGKLGSSGK